MTGRTRLSDRVTTIAVPACPACGGSGVPRFAGVPEPHEGPPGDWCYRRCSTCGSLWLDPRPRDEDLGLAYDAWVDPPEPFSDDDDDSAPRASWRSSLREGVVTASLGYASTSRDRARVEEVAANALARVHAVADRVGGPLMWVDARWGRRLLDVGCGDGRFLADMRERGWDVEGVETDPMAARAARRRGLRVHEGAVDTVGVEPESFDVVTLSHVIEHVIDPVRTLTGCRRALRSGGRLVAVTPNARALGLRWFGAAWGALDPPRHLVLFSERALVACARRAGFGRVSVRSTARQAGFLWHAGWWLRRRGALPGTFGVRPGSPSRIGATAFTVADVLAGRFGAGEELLLLATA